MLGGGGKQKTRGQLRDFEGDLVNLKKAVPSAETWGSAASRQGRENGRNSQGKKNKKNEERQVLGRRKKMNGTREYRIGPPSRPSPPPPPHLTKEKKKIARTHAV